MKKIKLIIVGGFLGAGKTTALLSLAEEMMKEGQKVAIVTNDQSANLVDSASIRDYGYPVMEVTKGCFCCNFDDFIDKLHGLIAEFEPDVILAEPVGSCTDLIATIMKPLKQDTSNNFLISPLSVMVDPRRLDSLMKNGDDTFRRHEISYLFVKQLEEADLIILNKVDLLDDESLVKYKEYLYKNFPQAKIICVSAANHHGLQDWITASEEYPEFKKASLSIVYDTYAAAEAALGWLNTSAEIQSDSGFYPDEYIYDIATSIRDVLKENNFEIAHMKMCIISNSDYSKLSCVGINYPICQDRKINSTCKKGQLLINIRANCSPDFLQELTSNILTDISDKNDLFMANFSIDCFAPTYPKPVHRL